MKDVNQAHGQIGIALLGSISAFSIWSSVNPSFFTIKAFNKDPEHEHHIRFGMKVGLLLSFGLAIALRLGYGKSGTYPAVLTGLTGAGLWLAYDKMLKDQKK